jgi:hypothetical protein
VCLIEDGKEHRRDMHDRMLRLFKRKRGRDLIGLKYGLILRIPVRDAANMFE